MATKRTTQKRTAPVKTDNFTLKLGHLDIPIVGMDQHEREGHNMLGVFYPMGGPIQVDTSSIPARQGEVLFHEILHAIINERGIPFEDDDAEERVVWALAKGFAAVIADNPIILDLLRKTIVSKQSLNLKR